MNFSYPGDDLIEIICNRLSMYTRARVAHAWIKNDDVISKLTSMDDVRIVTSDAYVHQIPDTIPTVVIPSKGFDMLHLKTIVLGTAREWCEVIYGSKNLTNTNGIESIKISHDSEDILFHLQMFDMLDGREQEQDDQRVAWHCARSHLPDIQTTLLVVPTVIPTSARQSLDEIISVIGKQADTKRITVKCSGCEACSRSFENPLCGGFGVVQVARVYFFETESVDQTLLQAACDQGAISLESDEVRGGSSWIKNVQDGVYRLLENRGNVRASGLAGNVANRFLKLEWDRDYVLAFLGEPVVVMKDWDDGKGPKPRVHSNVVETGAPDTVRIFDMPMSVAAQVKDIFELSDTTEMLINVKKTGEGKQTRYTVTAGSPISVGALAKLRTLEIHELHR